MKFYSYTIAIPILILFINYYFINQKPKKIIDYVEFVLKSVPSLFGYAFLLYFLESENYIDTSWAFYTVLFFLIPITLLVLLITLWGRKKKK